MSDLQPTPDQIAKQARKNARKAKVAEAIRIFGHDAVEMAILTKSYSDADAAYTTLQDSNEEDAAAAVEFLYFE